MSIYKKNIEQRTKLLDKNVKYITIRYPDTILKYVGSYAKKDIKLFSDIDIAQYTRFNNTNDINFYKELEHIIKHLPKNIHFNYLKCGIKEYNYIFTGYFKLPFVLVNYKPQVIINDMKKKKLDKLISLVKDKPTVRQYITLFNSIKDEYRLPNIYNKDISKYKSMINEQYYKHKTRINYIWEIEKDFYVDISNVLFFGYKNDNYYINVEKGSHPLITYYEYLLDENYLKCIKVLYTRILYLQNKKLEKKVSKYLNSKVNILNLIINYLTVLSQVYELNISSFKLFDRHIKAFMKQLKPVITKEELVIIKNISKEIKIEADISEYIDELNNFIKKNSYKALKEFVKEFNEPDYLFEALDKPIPLL